MDFLYLERYGIIPTPSVRAALDEILGYVELNWERLSNYSRRYLSFVVKKLDNFSRLPRYS